MRSITNANEAIEQTNNPNSGYVWWHDAYWQLNLSRVEANQFDAFHLANHGMKGPRLIEAWRDYAKKQMRESVQSPGYDPNVRATNSEYTKRPDHVTKFPVNYPKCGE